MMNQTYWLQAETDIELSELLDMFWGFHDFKIEKVNYTSSKDQIDLLLEYDTHEFSVLLRFAGKVSMNFQPVQDYDVDWLTGSSIGRNKQGQIVWAGADDIDGNDLPDDIIWIAGDSVRYAYIDKNGEPKQLPEDMIHQVWHTLNYEIGKYEDIEKEFHPRYFDINDDISS